MTMATITTTTTGNDHNDGGGDSGSGGRSSYICVLVYFVLHLLTVVFICLGKTKIQILFVGVAGMDPRSIPKHLVCM